MSTGESVAVDIPQEPNEKRRRMISYRAALRGDWKYYIDEKEKINFGATISDNEDTALHIGATLKSCKFARKLLHELDGLEVLVVRNKSGNTAFCLGAGSGKLELAKEMIEVAQKMVNEKKYGNLELAMIKEKYGNLEEVEKMKNNGEYLAQVKGNNEMSPLVLAVLFGHKEMTYWLYHLTKTSLKPPDRIELLLTLIRNGFHEFAQQLLKEHKELATAHDETEETALHVLAQLPVANQQGVWKRIKRCFKRYHTLQLLEKYTELANEQGLWEKIKKCFNRFLRSIEKQSPEMKLVHRVWKLATSSPAFDQNSYILEVARKQIFVAAERGNIEFLKILIREYPDLIFHVDENWHSIFHFAVKYRHEEIFRLIHEIGSNKDFMVAKIDKKGNNILHLAGMLAPPERLHSVSGVALQMQRELLWFEEVKKLMNPLDAEAKNKDGNSGDAKVKNSVDPSDAEAKNGDGNSGDAKVKNSVDPSDAQAKNGDGNSGDAEKKDGKTPRALFSEQHQKLKDDGENG